MAAAAAKQSGTSKRKRTRKTKRRTTAVAEEGDSSDSSSGSEDEQAAPAVAARPAVRAPSPESSSSSSSDSSSDENDGNDTRHNRSVTRNDANGEAGKRRRKRTRKTKQPQAAAGDGNVEQTTIKSAAGPTPPVPVSADIDGFKLLADPSSDARLSEATRAALAYAKQYALDRPSWKFSKARQEHLIRHMLSRAVQAEAGEGEGAGVKVSKVDNEATADEYAQEPANAPSWWPDEWNACVAFYLSTVQGGAKARLVDRLQTAAKQSIPDPPPAAPAQPTEASASTVAADATAQSTAKSVSFADMAAQADRQDASQEGASDPATAIASREQALFERTRAHTLLTAMGQSS